MCSLLPAVGVRIFFGRPLARTRRLRLRRFSGDFVETFSFLSDSLWLVNSCVISELSTIRTTVNRHQTLGARVGLDPGL